MDKQKPDTKDPVAEGARARALGRPKDACPHPAGSTERTAWFEGYDGAPSDDGSDHSPRTGGPSPRPGS